MMHKAFDHFKNALKEGKLRLTKQRAAILRLFLAREGHTCADELYFALRKRYQCLGRATVYRTVKLLQDLQLAQEVNFTGSRRRFEHAFEHEHHDHFICEACGKVVEFFDAQLEAKQDSICKKYGFAGKKHTMQITGLCRRCQ